MQSVVIDSILWQGPNGGAIFNALTTDNGKFRFVADMKIMPRAPATGEVWEIRGVFKNHPKHGSHIVVSHAVLARPAGNLIKNLISGSSHFPGVGSVGAEKLWDAFNDDIYSLLAAGVQEPFAEILKSKVLGAVVVQGWQKYIELADVYQWMDRHGILVFLSQKLLNIYGKSTIDNLEDNPYRLVAFLSWHDTDQVGRSMGITANDPRRLVGGVDAAVYFRLNHTHTLTHQDVFAGIVAKLLNCDIEVALEAIKIGLETHAIQLLGENIQGLGTLSMERYISERAILLANNAYHAKQMTIRQFATPEALEQIYASFADKTDFPLNYEQREAVRMAVTNQISCITGGAGVGKTTLLRAIILAAEHLGFGGVYQMALSGRAAKRMQDTTGHKSYTIARFLIAVETGQIDLSKEPLIIIDEASMLDLPHCYRIMRHMQPGCRLILMGDAAQLPPIGFGLTFHIMVKHPAIQKVELTKVHRSAASTGIPQASNAIRNGIVPRLSDYCGKNSGVSFIDCETPQIVDRLLDIINDLGGVKHTQIIGAVKTVDPQKAGVIRINAVFHDLLTLGKTRLSGFAEGEPVIYTINDYDIGLLNGSMGWVKSVGEKSLIVNFDGIESELGVSKISNMEHAYAITAHKSQGSQFERVIVPVFQNQLLDRTLVYTAITRAKLQVVLIGDRNVFEQAVLREPLSDQRETGLRWHMDKIMEIGCPPIY